MHTTGLGWRRSFAVRLGAATVLAIAAGSCTSPKPVFEYVLVSLEAGESGSRVEEERAVLIDTKSLGRTGELIEFEGGKCVITLDRPDEYEPAEHDVTVEDTTALTPLKLIFTRKS